MESKYEGLIEHALTYGCVSAAKKYRKLKITESDVRQIVLLYGKENGSVLPCHCFMESMKGESIMCFSCTGLDESLMIKKAINS